MDLLRQEIATCCEMIVVKVGTRVLTGADGTLSESRVESLVGDLCTLLDSEHKVVLVSSGAVGAGMGRLGLARRPLDLARLQAIAAVGQSRLIETYDRALRRHNRHAAQLLLTAEDMNDRKRYLNVRNTILTLIEYGAVPIINENDTVSVNELLTTFGDNDHLAAIVTNCVRAPLLVILSDVDGLYDGDPDNPDSRVISTVTHIDDKVLGYVREGTSHVSKGGMGSKLRAARIATTAGENVIIASGHAPDTLAKIAAGESVGTLFLAQGKSVSPRKRWIGFTARPRGRVVVDHGARRAIETQGRSLLAIGVVDAEGDFEKGDVVSLCDPGGGEFARGLTNYPAREVLCIRGLRTEQIEEVLGRRPYEEVVHRDNMVVTSVGQ